MATRPEVTPNRRGVKSRELVLDAAERVMAEHGYDGTSVARVVEEAGIPLSSVYHYFGSKNGILLAVMERGAERFFAELPLPSERLGSSRQHVERMASTLIDALGRHPNFLRLLIVFATQPPAAGSGEVREVVSRVRATALRLLRQQLALAYGDDPEDPAVAQLARFALAAIDGAFVASQTDENATLEGILLPWAASVDALHAILNRRGPAQKPPRPKAGAGRRAPGRRVRR
jgi:AcrR family transcriptional regulator